jgi:hypothetical protein
LISPGLIFSGEKPDYSQEVPFWEVAQILALARISRSSTSRNQEPNLLFFASESATSLSPRDSSVSLLGQPVDVSQPSNL